MTTQDNEPSEFPNRFDSKSQRRARARGGLASLGDALAAAGVCDSGEPMPERARAAGDIEAMPIHAALASVEQPGGAMLFEAQGQIDMAIAGACARKLAARMLASGKQVNAETIADATAAGALALTQWRCEPHLPTTGAGADNQPETLAARVAWRAVVAEMSRDTLGDSLPIHTVSDDWLWHNAEQHDESRAERAARFKVERQAATRQLRLCRRLANLPSGRGKRAAVIERIGNAASMLLLGMRLDEAATAAGFNASGHGRGRQTAGDRLVRAIRKLGLIGDGFAIRRA